MLYTSPDLFRWPRAFDDYPARLDGLLATLENQPALEAYVREISLCTRLYSSKWGPTILEAPIEPAKRLLELTDLRRIELRGE